MKYKFVSKEQARNDWENGMVQIEHNKAGRSIKLNSLLNTDVEGNWVFYIKLTESPFYNCSENFKIFNIPYIPTDELWEMIFGEYQEEIIGYELNRKVSIVRVAKFLCKKQSELMGLITDKEVIKEASDLGILSTCFKPVYRGRYF